VTRLSTVAGTAAVALAAANSAPTLALLRPLGPRFGPRLVGLGRAGHVALTFDDGPDPTSTPAILDCLAALDCHATFFLLGRMVDEAPEIAAQIVSRGHEIAVHGDRHRSALIRSPRQLHDDLRTARDKIRQATGCEPRWFRPPYGHLSVTAWRAARALGLDTILWTAWGRDWRADATAASVVDDVGRGVLDGGTILLHDSDCTSSPRSWRATLDALPPLVAQLRSRRLEPGPLRDHWAPQSH